MSGIYIPNMEMPKNCFDCDFSLLYNEMADLVCPLLKLEVSGCGFNTLEECHNDCPLIAVSDHGRLGDLDELAGRIKAWITHNRRAINEDIEPYVIAIFSGILDTPTIIPGDKEEANANDR